MNLERLESVLFVENERVAPRIRQLAEEWGDEEGGSLDRSANWRIWFRGSNSFRPGAPVLSEVEGSTETPWLSGQPQQVDQTPQ